MKFDVNGTTVEFTNQGSLTAEFAQAGAQYTGAIFGSDATSKVNLSISDSTEITTATYSGFTNKNNVFTAAVIGYFDQNGTNYGQSSSIDPNLKITVSELTATTIRGTFNGTLMASGKAEINITNGEFFVKRAN